MPADIGSLFLLIGLESVIGLAIGVAARLLISCMNVTGNIIAMQTGLGFAIAVDPTQGAQGAIVATFLVTLAILMLYITGGHAVLFDGLMRSYVLFPPGIVPPVGDFLELVVRFVSSSFLLGVELAAPFLFAGLVFNAGLALVAKMMPQFQVFFIAMPASILGGFGMLMLLLGVMMTIFLDRFRDAFSGLVN
jgi:flagellar biosynthetic protein FliR